MTDEQNPTGGQPQDPSQPPADGQPPSTPPPPPVNPYEQQPAAPDPAAPPAYGQPQPPAYGEAQPPAYGQPQYGQPAQPAYGQPPQPQYAQPGMPAAAFPGGPVESPPGKGMAITALVLSLLCCFPIGLILAIVVLVRSKDGKNYGKGLAIGAIVASVISAIVLAAGAYALTQVDWDDLLPVEQLKTGECLNASNLTDDDEDFVEDIEEVTCDGPHDAEVLVTQELSKSDAEDYDPASSSLCTELITDAGLADKIGTDVGYFGLTTDSEPQSGDKLVCIAYKLDGTKLDAPL